MVSLVSCSGGTSTPPPPPPPAKDFTLAISPSTLSLQQMGDGAALNISITPLNGFTGGVNISFPNLPAGLSVSAGPVSGPPYYASPTAPLSVGISASSAAALGNATITVQGVAGSLTHSMALSASVTAAIVFQVKVSPSTVTIGPNGQATAQVTLVPGSNFGSNSVLLSSPSADVANTGVTLSLSSNSLTAAQPQATLSFQSGPQVKTGTFPVPLTATLAAQVVNIPLTLTVTNPAQSCNQPSRSTLRRTDKETTGVVYDPVHKLVFAAVQATNTVQVFSAPTAQTVATIPIPAPWQLDITPDGSSVLVGTFTNYMYWIDPVTLRVTGKAYVDSGLDAGNLGIFANSVRPVTLANGKVLVSISGDPMSAPLEWDPVANTWSNPSPPGFTSGYNLVRRSADHSKALVANLDTLTLFDSATDSYGPIQNISAGAAALSSNGSRIAVLGPSPTLPGGNQLSLLDQNFQVLATTQLMNASDLIFSRDDSRLFVQTGNYTTAVSAADLSLLGTVSGPPTEVFVYPTDIDETNLIFTPRNGSLTFTDAAAPCAIGVNQPVNISLSPDHGTVKAPAAVTLNAVDGITAQSQVYFGPAPGSPQAAPGTNLTPNPPTSILVTPPSSQAAGAVNVTVTNPDGSLAIAPDAFSYGSTVLAVGTNSGPATGGTSVSIYGYGLSFDPAQIQVTIGGNAATVTRAFAWGTWNYPFPIDQIDFTTPAGTPGAADIVITTPVGKATVTAGFHYLESVQNYTASGALTQAVYDRSRQRLYAADGASNQVDVFDLASRQFLAPITVGNAPQALAITPDFNTLVVSNGADSTISTVDLTGLNVTRTLSVAKLPDLPLQCGQPIPYAVATTSNNQAVISLACPNVTEGELVVLNLATQSLGCGASRGCTAMMAAYPQFADQILLVSGTPDGRFILLFNGAIGLWDVQADTFTARGAGAPPPYPVTTSAAAADGTAFSVLYDIFDPMISELAMMQDVDYLQSALKDNNRLPGEKLHASGALLYYPDTNGFTIYDVHQGHLKQRVALPLQTALTFDALTIDETGSRVFLLTTTGLTVVNLADLPLSIGNLQPAQGPATGGTTVVLRGSGFQNGAQVLFDKTPAGVKFIDGSTLQLTTPALSPGGIRIKVLNPDGTQYSLDDAFTAQ